MKTLLLNRNIIVSILVVMLLIYGSQGISYSQFDAPTVAPGENNTSLAVKFQITLDEGVDENAYQIQLRRKAPQGEWISKCVVIQYGNRTHIAGDPDVFASAVYIFARVIFHTGDYSDGTFRIRAIFADLEPGATYEARYRDTNVSECAENPPSPDPWSHVAEGTTHLVTPPRAEFVDINLAREVRYALGLDTKGGHIDLLKIPQESLQKLTELELDDEGITDLTGLEHATQLTELDLWDNQISDISPLAQLTQLMELDISRNQISDISPLAQLTQLTELDFNRNPITDISPLRTIFQTVVVIEPGLENEKHLSIYWEDGFQIRRMDFANPHVQDIITEGTSDVEDIALDITNRKVYWGNSRDIKRANLDGTGVENVVTGLYYKGLALDVSAGKIYWSDSDLKGNIKRANLEGTDIEDVVKIKKWFGNIDLDVAGGKIYWTTYYDHGIWYANLDGTDVQNVVNVGGWPTDIALDVADGKIYWMDDLGDKIGRANLDGTDVEDVVTDIFMDGFALDVSAGKIYWAEFGSFGRRSGGKIQRANLDGTEVQDVVTGLHFPTGLVLNAFTDVTELGQLKGDVNGDGSVNIHDLVMVATNIGQAGQRATDVNGDEIVDIMDLVLVAGALGGDLAAPAAHPEALRIFTASDIQKWLAQAQHLELKGAASQRGIFFLEQLLAALTLTETTLLPNYPNPFNPETWIPYHLAKDADVTLRIYSVSGTLVRTLTLGHQAAGVYQNRSRAVYWNGKNAQGESVASGVYFYTLTAGEFTETRRMLIRK